MKKTHDQSKYEAKEKERARLERESDLKREKETLIRLNSPTPATKKKPVYVVEQDGTLLKYDGKEVFKWDGTIWDYHRLQYVDHPINPIDTQTPSFREAKLKSAEIAVKSLCSLVLESVPEQFSKKNDMYTKGDEKAHFISESYLYNLVGKQDARDILTRVQAIRRALGMGRRD